ncbi:UNVERIFIED_CONTAM: hypothetical protein NY603_41665, partial [Bacteroidetes bacterium 56_B9]
VFAKEQFKFTFITVPLSLGKRRGRHYFGEFSAQKKHPEGWSKVERPTRLELASSSFSWWLSTS